MTDEKVLIEKLKKTACPEKIEKIMRGFLRANICGMLAYPYNDFETCIIADLAREAYLGFKRLRNACRIYISAPGSDHCVTVKICSGTCACISRRTVVEEERTENESLSNFYPWKGLSSVLNEYVKNKIELSEKEISDLFGLFYVEVVGKAGRSEKEEGK